MTGKGLEEFVVRDDLGIPEIKDLIAPYVDLDLEQGTFQFKEEYDDAETRIQLLVPLLVLQALEQNRMTESAAVDPIDLAEITNNSVGKAYPVIRELEQNGVLENVNKKYRIDPNSSEKIHSQFETSGQAEAAN